MYWTENPRILVRSQSVAPNFSILRDQQSKYIMYLFENPTQQLTWDYIIKDVLDQSEIDFILDYAKNNPLEDGKIGEITQDNNFELRRSQILFLSDYEYFNDLYQKLVGTMIMANNEHFKYNVTYSEPFQYSEYHETDNGYYGVHTDTNLRNIHGYTRKLTFSLLLNDPSEFEGGDLCYHHSTNPSIVDQQKGDMIFFPSFLPHSVSPVTSGTRKSLVGWTCGPNFS